MKIIEAYQSVDGMVFTSEEAAEKHDIDLIGEELDGLIFHVLKLDVSKHQTLKGIIAAIKEKRELAMVIAKLNKYLSHSGDDYE